MYHDLETLLRRLRQGYDMLARVGLTPHAIILNPRDYTILCYGDLTRPRLHLLPVVQVLGCDIVRTPLDHAPIMTAPPYMDMREEGADIGVVLEADVIETPLIVDESTPPLHSFPWAVSLYPLLEIDTSDKIEDVVI